MEFSTQVRTFLIIAVTGLFLGVLFDIYRVMQRCLRPPWLVTSVADLFYCLLASGIAFAALLMSNWGEFRFYVVIALFSGMFFYYRLASRHVMKFILVLLKVLAGLWRTAKKVVAITVVRPAILTLRTFLWPVKFMAGKWRGWYKKWRPPPPPPAEIPPRE